MCNWSVPCVFWLSVACAFIAVWSHIHFRPDVHHGRNSVFNDRRLANGTHHLQHLRELIQNLDAEASQPTDMRLQVEGLGDQSWDKWVLPELAKILIVHQKTLQLSSDTQKRMEDCLKGIEAFEVSMTKVISAAQVTFVTQNSIQRLCVDWLRYFKAPDIVLDAIGGQIQQQRKKQEVVLCDWANTAVGRTTTLWTKSSALYDVLNELHKELDKMRQITLGIFNATGLEEWRQDILKRDTSSCLAHNRSISECGIPPQKEELEKLLADISMFQNMVYEISQYVLTLIGGLKAQCVNIQKLQLSRDCLITTTCPNITKLEVSKNNAPPAEAFRYLETYIDNILLEFD